MGISNILMELYTTGLLGGQPAEERRMAAERQKLELEKEKSALKLMNTLVGGRGKPAGYRAPGEGMAAGGILEPATEGYKPGVPMGEVAGELGLYGEFAKMLPHISESMARKIATETGLPAARGDIRAPVKEERLLNLLKEEEGPVFSMSPKAIQEREEQKEIILGLREKKKGKPTKIAPGEGVYEEDEDKYVVPVEKPDKVTDAIANYSLVKKQAEAAGKTPPTFEAFLIQQKRASKGKGPMTLEEMSKMVHQWAELERKLEAGVTDDPIYGFMAAQLPKEAQEMFMKSMNEKDFTAIAEVAKRNREYWESRFNETSVRRWAAERGLPIPQLDAESGRWFVVKGDKRFWINPTYGKQTQKEE